MSGTAQTIANLYSAAFQAGQTNAIGSDDMRNLTATLAARTNVINVKWPEYGAVGNNSTDDTAAINAALTAAGNAGGGTVVIPGGTTYAYGTSDRIRVPANVTLWGYGATLRSLNPDTYTTIQLMGDHSHVMGVRLVSAGTVRGTYDGACGVFIDGRTGAKNNVIRDCYFYGMSSTCIYVFGGAYGILIDNNTIEETWTDAIHISNAYAACYRIKIINNRVYHCGDDYIGCVSYPPRLGGVDINYDIQIIGNYVEGNYWANGIDIHSNNCLVMGNMVKHCRSAGIYVGTEEELSYQNVDIIGNWIENCNLENVHDGDLWIYGVAGLTLTNLNIIGNHVYNPNAAHGIQIYGSANNVRNVNLSNNFVSNCPYDGINIVGSACSNLLISGNMCTTLGRTGISVAAGNVGVGITGNHISAAGGLGGSVSPYGINNASVRATIVGNTVYDPSSALSNGFNLASTTADCVVTGNNWGPTGQNLNGNSVVANG